MLIRNSPRIVQIWEASKKHGRADICSIDNKILIFKNSFTGHCQISKMERFEKVVDGFELLTIFSKTFHIRRLAGLWIRLCLFQPGEETNAIAGTIEVIQRKQYQAF